MKRIHFWEIVTQLVKIFSAFHGTQEFITVFTWARHWSLSKAKCIQSSTSDPLSLRFILILSSHSRQVSPSSLHFRFSNQNPVCMTHLSHACYMPHSSHPPWFYRPNNIWWRVQVMKFLNMKSSLVSEATSTNRASRQSVHMVGGNIYVRNT
jgi:hypothetical protein